MKLDVRGAVLLLLFSLPILGFCQKGFGIGKIPSWVKPDNFSNEVPDSADASGYYYLLYNYQYNVDKSQGYAHYAIKVINDKGLSAASSVDASYDPSYQQLQFHSLYVQRGNQKIDHLDRKNFEVLQREENLSRASYDGGLSAIVTLKDVKAGDIVVYSYSITGINPVFKGHFGKTFRLNFGVPAGRISYQLYTSPSRKLQFKDFGKMPERKETSVGSQKVYSWEESDVPAIRDEDRIPYWYNLYNQVQITDFESWNEFSKWALDLFKVRTTRSPQLRKFIDSLKRIDNEEHRVLAAIRVIQENVRYFSFVDGMSSYKPHDPSEVFANRYGDCKDKALLLSEVLNEIGVTSYPVLVSTDIGKVMNEQLPSPFDFNHAIVQFKFKDSLYYIDATMTSQRGGLKKIVTPSYFFGVVADEKQPGLTEISRNVNWSVIRATEDFVIDEIGGVANLKVATIYTGEEADPIRDFFKSKTRTEVDQDYLNFYANEYPEIQLGKSVSFADDTLKNEIVVNEEYKVPGMWTYDSTNRRQVAKFYGRVISGYLVYPASRVRTLPFNIRRPLDIELITNVHLPEEWTIEKYNKSIVAPGFNFNTQWRYSNQVIQLRHSLHNTAEFVEAAQTPEYLKKVDDVYNELSFEIYKGDDAIVQTPEGTQHARLALLILVLGAAMILPYRKLNAINPRSRQETERYEAIGGWLILAAIGITTWPFRGIYFLFSNWQQYLNIFASGTFTLNKVVLFSDLLVRIALIALSALCAFLFWQRRTSFPHLVSALYVVNLFWVVTDMIVVRYVYESEPMQESVTALITGIVIPAIWIPYFMASERSKGTFTQRLENEES